MNDDAPRTPASTHEFRKALLIAHAVNGVGPPAAAYRWFAREAGVHYITIWRWATGRTPVPDQAMRLLKQLARETHNGHEEDPGGARQRARRARR